MNKAKLLAIVASTIIGLTVSFFVLSGTHTRIAAIYWRQQLAVAADDRVEIVISQIGELNTAGIRILVEALDSGRECVAQAAKLELFAQLEGWRTLSANEHVLRLTALAEVLAEQIDHFGPAARRDAMDLAARILIRPVKGSAIDSNKLLAASEKVLRIGLNTRVEPIRLKSAEIADAARAKSGDSLTASRLPLPKPSESLGQALDDPTLPSGDGSSGKSISSQAPPGEDERQTADSLANQPRLLDRQEALRSLGSLNQLPRASRIPDHAETAADAGRSAKQAKQSADSGRGRSLSHVDPEGSDRRLSSSLAAEDAVDLMRVLNAENDTSVAAVEAELIRRGFSAAQLDLARRLFDPDPAVRKKLVQDLPSLQGVDAVPWLLRLCHDTDAEVRLAAITFLATSTDPDVLDEVEQIVQRDTDSGVRRIADRIAQQRNARR